MACLLLSKSLIFSQGNGDAPELGFFGFSSSLFVVEFSPLFLFPCELF